MSDEEGARIYKIIYSDSSSANAVIPEPKPHAFPSPAAEAARHFKNARVESFHGRLREECLAVSWLENLFDARRKIAAWRKEYNEERPHSSLGYRTPTEFAAALRTEESCGKDAPWKSLKSDFPTALGNPAEAAGFPLSRSSGDGGPSTADEVKRANVV